jgi:glycosyltransferase involved in cell wall biosynthesis
VTVLTTPKEPRYSTINLPKGNYQVVEVPVPFFTNIDRQYVHNPKYAGIFQKIKYTGIVQRLRNTGAFNSARMPDIHDLWALKILPFLKTVQWDAVVTTGLPYSMHIIGFFLKKRGLVRRWIVDWRDLWTNNHFFDGLPILRQIEKNIEKTFHRTCDVITTVSPPLARILRKSTTKPVHVIYNGFDPDDYLSLPTQPIFPQDGIFRIVHTGPIYEKRDPRPFFRAIKLLEDQNILINNPLKVIVAGYYFPFLDLAIEQEGVKQYVEFRGLVPRPDALRMQRDADALLLVDMKSEGILTGKVFEYLVAGPPILVVGGDAQSSAGALVEECKRGRNYQTDVKALASDLIHLLHEKRHKRDTGNKSINIANLAPEILQFSREQQARRMLDIIQEVVV